MDLEYIIKILYFYHCDEYSYSLLSVDVNFSLPAGITDIPEGSDSHGPVIISGVLVPELVEELNDAYNDLLQDIGNL